MNNNFYYSKKNMNYSNIIKTKKKLDSILSSTKEGLEKAKEFTGNTTKDLKNSTIEFKDNIKSSILDKVSQEFRKNYPTYVISYISTYLVDEFAKGKKEITISMEEEEDALTIERVMKDIGEDMISEEELVFYTSNKVLKNLYQFLIFYFSRDPQLDIMKYKNKFVLSLVDNEEDVEDED